MEFGLLLAAALAVATACASLAWVHRAMPDRRRRTCDLIAAGLLGGIVAGRVWAMVAAGTNPIAHPADLLIVRGGVDTIAATLGALAAMAWSARRDPALLDAAAPGAVFGLAAWHASCVVRDSCLGSATSLPWGWAVEAGGTERHPVELYAAFGLAAAGWLVLRLLRRRPSLGFTALAALGGAAGVRAATEPLRLGLGGDLFAEYLIAVTLAGLAALVLRLLRRPTPR